MKKIRLVFAAAIALSAVFAVLATGCKKNNANYPERTFMVTFNSNGGSAVEAVVAKGGALLAEPAAPTMAAYYFVGWFTDNNTFADRWDFSNTRVTRDITLYAQWATVIYTVTFETNGGSAIDSLIVAEGGTMAEPTAPTKAGYTFDGWFTDSDLTTPAVFPLTITADITLYANWTVNYTVTFDTNGGSAIDSVIVAEGGTVAEPTAPTKAGSTFDGWFTDSDLTAAAVFPLTITSDTTLYAKWTVNDISYTVTFDTNGGSAIDPQSVPEGGTVAEPTAPTRAGYTFAGWFTDNNTFASQVIFPYTVNASVTFYANWVAGTYTAVIHNADDLNNVRNDLTGSYIVVNDFSMASYPAWVPLGNSATPFTGKFDGNGHKITDLLLNEAATTPQGLFGYAGQTGLPQTTISNVNIVATATILKAGTGSQGCGALLGCGYNVAISGCSLTGAGATGPVIMNHNALYTGGLVGQLNNSSVEDCHVYDVNSNTSVASQGFLVGATSNANSNTGGGGADGMVTIDNCSAERCAFTSTGGDLGGILGYAQNVPVSITNCKSVNCSLTTTATNNIKGVGSIVGTIGVNTDQTTAGSLVMGCVSVGGTVTSGAGAAGGICGTMQSASAIINCSNSATVTESTGSNINNRAGGICGSIGSFTANAPGSVTASINGLIMGCVNTGNVTGGTQNGATAHAGGICGINAGGMIAGCKQAGGTINGKSGTTAGTDGIANVGGICGGSSGVISGCCVTGGAITAVSGFSHPAVTIRSNIISNNLIDANGTTYSTTGTIETCYYATSVVNNTANTVTPVTTTGTDFASGWPSASTVGWMVAPTAWGAPYAPAGSLWAVWASPWSSLGSAPSTFPTLIIEQP